MNEGINSIYLSISVNVSCQLQLITHTLCKKSATSSYDTKSLSKKPGLISTQKGVFSLLCMLMGAVQVHKTVDFNSRNATVPADSK